MENQPTELLHEIFIHCFDTFADEATKGQLVHQVVREPGFILASVCKKWRNIAMTSPVLWSYLYLDFARADVGQDILQVYPIRKLYILLKWSKNVGLQIFFRCPTFKTKVMHDDDDYCYRKGRYALEVLELLKKHQERWQVFHFEFQDIQFVEMKWWRALALLGSGGDCNFTNRSVGLQDEILWQLFRGSFKKLEQLTIVGPKMKRGYSGKRRVMQVEKFKFGRNTKVELVGCHKIIEVISQTIV